MPNLKVKLISKSVNSADFPVSGEPEFAFIGRSNVGKSSLINFLVDNKNVAPVSGKPGKTTQVFHYLVEDSWFLVDLPGYGYAKVSKERRGVWGEMIENYILNRENLHTLFVLVDGGIPMQKIDAEFILWLLKEHVPISIVFTKIDKARQADLHILKSKYENLIMSAKYSLPMFFSTSVEKKRGREEVLEFIKGEVAGLG